MLFLANDSEILSTANLGVVGGGHLTAGKRKNCYFYETFKYTLSRQEEKSED